MTDERIETGYAALQVDSDSVPVQVSGIAIGEGDVTIGGSGKQTLWPRDTLQEAAEGLKGQPIATSKNHTADGAKPQTPSDAVVGQVTWAGYKPGVGVLYEGEIDDPDIARSVENGRLEVSPLVSRDIEPLDESEEAEFVATDINRWRDLATVVNGAAPSNEITVGDNPMKAEALHKAVESLQDGPSLDDPVDVPERVQNAAQAALDADEEGLIPDSCGTGTGTSRAEALANGDVEVNDFLTRGEDDKTPIPAYLNSHADDGTTDDPPTEWSASEWESCGNAGLARWGWYEDWAKSTANELSRQRGENEPYESMASSSTAGKAEALQLSEAREPTFDGTETSEEQPWGEISKDLGDVVDALGVEADTVADLSEDTKDAIAQHTLLGDPNADTFGELFFFPVVNYNNQNLNEGALNAVRGGRGESADIADEAFSSAEDMAAQLLAENFEGYEMDNGELLSPSETESMADVSDVSEDTLVKWNSSGDRPAFGRVVDVRTEGDEPLDGEIDGDQTINPPAALIEVHVPDGDEFMATDTMVGHTLNSDTLTVIDELPNPESLAHHLENMADVPEEFVFDNPGEAMSKAQDMGFEEIHTHGEGEDTVFMPGPSHDMLMEELDMGGDEGSQESMTPSNPANVDSLTMDDISDEELEALEQRREFENPKLVEQNEYESLQDRVAEVRSVMEEALSERTELKDATIEALEFEALAQEFENDEGELQVEAMSQTPESGEPESGNVEALSDDDVQKAEALYSDYQTFGNERLKEDIVETLGVSDFEEATEVLD